MEKRIACFLFIFCTSLPAALGQMSNEVQEAILTLLLSKPIAQKVFFEYPDSTWNGPGMLPGGGTYAFIPTTVTFREVYPSILEELQRSIHTDGLIGKRKFYSDTVKSMYITGSISFELFTVFRKIEVSDKIVLEFITTSLWEEEAYRDKYVSVHAELIKNKEKWQIAECNIKSIPWTKYFEP